MGSEMIASKLTRLQNGTAATSAQPVRRACGTATSYRKRQRSSSARFSDQRLSW